MLSTIGVWLATKLLQLPLTMQQRTKLVGAMLDGLNAVPIQDVIEVKEGRMYVEGKPIDYEKSVILRDAARAMRGNQARELVRDQIAAEAGKRGIVQGDTPEKLYFYRAALWSMQAEQELYEALAGEISTDGL